MRIILSGALAACLVAGCSSQSTPQPANQNEASAADPAPIATESPRVTNAAESAALSAGALPPVEPPAPGTPGGLPDDRTPVSEAPFAETSAQGAANVVQTYYALLREGDYGKARALWSGGGEASGMSATAFADSFAKYAQYNAEVGAPGEIEGAAGSLYVEVPVVIYGRMKSGEEVHMKGPVTLRRVNDVPGSTAEQRRWHISASGVRPRPQ